MQIFYTIYETTNSINGYVYRGAHQTFNLKDDYLGSGIRLQRAIKKYGRSNFSKQYLFFAFDATSMYEFEKLFVTTDWINTHNTYNLIEGGRGSHFKTKENIKIYQYNSTGDLMNTFKNLNEACFWIWKNLKKDKEQAQNLLYKCCSLNSINKKGYGYHWSFIPLEIKTKGSKKIQCIETQKVFSSIGKAAKHFNKNVGSIRDSVNKGWGVLDPTSNTKIHFRLY